MTSLPLKMISPSPTKETGTELKMCLKSCVHVGFQQRLPSFSGQKIQLNVTMLDKPLAILSSAEEIK